MKHLIHLAFLACCALATPFAAFPQAQPSASPADIAKIYARLLPQIDKIPAYDNHSHATFPDDSDMDAQASPPGESTVMRLRDSNPEFVAAAKSLFGYPYNDFSPEHAKWLIDKKKAAEASGSTAYWDGILDKLNIETCLANRVALAPYLDPKRFHWVFFVDSFLFPFDNRGQTGKNTDLGVYIPLQEKVLQRYEKQESLTAIPADLAGYESFVRQTLADNQKKGAVAMKFEVAYFRSLYFARPSTRKSRSHLRQISFRRRPHLTTNTALFRTTSFECSSIKPANSNFPSIFTAPSASATISASRNGNPLNLENVLRDPRYKETNFVLIHGGYPHTLEMIWLTAAKNVYTDSSLMGYYVYPSELKNILKQWISLYPEKIMFGSDAFPFNDAVGAEETFWLAIHSARTAVAQALAELVAENAITEAKALELARMYLHDNAAHLYGDKK